MSSTNRSCSNKHTHEAAKAAADAAEEATWASLREEEREAGQEREPDKKLEGWGYYLEVRDEAGDSDHDFLDY